MELTPLIKADAIPVQVGEEPTAALAEYAGISIAFTVRRVMDVAADPAGGFTLSERVLEAPYVKDYDAVDGDSPKQWARRFDLTNWGLLVARVDGRRVGGAAVVFDTPGVTILRGRKDVVLLWDIRVAAEARGAGVGSALFREAESWARARGCRRLEVETQNVNVPACRFYARQGCTLESINRFAYPDLPNEVQLIWIKDLL
jgi:GNAT superfamily N-acetyltransferase